MPELIFPTYQSQNSADPPQYLASISFRFRIICKLTKGFTVWLAGAGVKVPFTYGSTDDFGYQAVPDQLTTIYDLHATILHLLGLDHEQLSYYHNGIDRRLTDVHGHVLKETLA